MNKNGTFLRNKGITYLIFIMFCVCLPIQGGNLHLDPYEVTQMQPTQVAQHVIRLIDAGLSVATIANFLSAAPRFNVFEAPFQRSSITAAIRANNPDLVRYLLTVRSAPYYDNDAFQRFIQSNINRPDRQGRIPLQLAVDYHSLDSKDLEKNAEIIDFLLETGANPFVSLNALIKTNKIPIVKRLLEAMRKKLAETYGEEYETLKKKYDDIVDDAFLWARVEKNDELKHYILELRQYPIQPAPSSHIAATTSTDEASRPSAAAAGATDAESPPRFWGSRLHRTRRIYGAPESPPQAAAGVETDAPPRRLFTNDEQQPARTLPPLPPIGHFTQASSEASRAARAATIAQLMRPTRQETPLLRTSRSDENDRTSFATLGVQRSDTSGAPTVPPPPPLRSTGSSGGMLRPLLSIPRSILPCSQEEHSHADNKHVRKMEKYIKKLQVDKVRAQLATVPPSAVKGLLQQINNIIKDLKLQDLTLETIQKNLRDAEAIRKIFINYLADVFNATP